MNPIQPVGLTAAMASPQDIADQKVANMRSIDEQVQHGEDVLRQETLRQIEHLRLQAEHQKALAASQLDQRLRAQELAAERDYQQEMAQLQDSVRQWRLALQQQAAQLVVEHKARRIQEEVNYRHYEIQLQ